MIRFPFREHGLCSAKAIDSTTRPTPRQVMMRSLQTSSLLRPEFLSVSVTSPSLEPEPGSESSVQQEPPVPAILHPHSTYFLSTTPSIHSEAHALHDGPAVFQRQIALATPQPDRLNLKVSSPPTSTPSSMPRRIQHIRTFVIYIPHPTLLNVGPATAACNLDPTPCHLTRVCCLIQCVVSPATHNFRQTSQATPYLSTYQFQHHLSPVILGRDSAQVSIPSEGKYLFSRYLKLTW